jgi:hypothetical protein
VQQQMIALNVNLRITWTIILAIYAVSVDFKELILARDLLAINVRSVALQIPIKCYF